MTVGARGARGHEFVEHSLRMGFASLYYLRLEVREFFTGDACSLLIEVQLRQNVTLVSGVPHGDWMGLVPCDAHAICHCTTRL